MEVCAQCGSVYAARSRSCPHCGAPASEPAGRPTRKVVTALFCDVVESTALGERLDPEVLSGVLERYFSLAREIVERHGGTVEKFIGDAVVAFFGVPRVHEDDALRAVRSAVEIVQALPGVAEETGIPLQVRTGVNTGLVLAGHSGTPAIGDALNVAARLEQAARPGEIIIGEQTLLLVRDAVEVEPLEPLALKGKSEGVSAFRLLAVDPVAPGRARRLDAPMVGRGRELAMLCTAWERTVETGECHLFTVLGAAGVGKSRLVAELAGGLGDGALFLSGRCLPYGDAITFWPLMEALAPVRARAEKLIGMLDGGSVGTPAVLFSEVRGLLDELALERPVLLHIDDLQWAEPMLLDLLDYVRAAPHRAALMLLCSARLEFLEQHSTWDIAGSPAAACLLEPLRREEAEALLDQHPGLDTETRRQILATAQGNPLFLQEMAALADEGRQTGVPPTIEALLSSRIENLEQAERDVLERAAIDGEVFHRNGLEALCEPVDAGDLSASLAALLRKGVIRGADGVAGEGAFRFSHLLLRDVAYEAIPMATKADLHERYGRWLAATAPEPTERDEIAGWHLERSVEFACKLGAPRDERLAHEAAERLLSAGIRAGDRWDVVASRALLERALSLCEHESSLHGLVAVELADQLMRVGDFRRAEDLLELAKRTPDVAARARLSSLEFLQSTRPYGEWQAVVRDALPELLDEYTKSGDDLALAKTHMLAFWMYWDALDSRAAGQAASPPSMPAGRTASTCASGRCCGIWRRLPKGPSRSRSSLRPRTTPSASRAPTWRRWDSSGGRSRVANNATTTRGWSSTAPRTVSRLSDSA